MYSSGVLRFSVLTSRLLIFHRDALDTIFLKLRSRDLNIYQNTICLNGD